MTRIFKLKKILPLFLAVVIGFASVYSIPQQKAHAFAIPAVLTGAAGVYVIGGLLVAAGAGAVGYDEYGEEINAHALRAWDNATQLSEDALNWSIDAAQGVGTGLVSLQGDFLNFIDGKLSEIGQSAIVMSSEVVSSNGVSIDARGHNEGQIISLYPPSGAYFIINGIRTTQVTLANGRYSNEVSMLNMDTGQWEYILFPDALKRNGPIMTFMASVGNDWSKVVTAYSMAGASLTMGTDALYAEIQAGISRTREMWESMRDAGLVIPVNDFVPQSIDGQRLDLDLATGALTDAAGKAYSGDWTVRLPNIKWRDKSDTIGIPGVYVDTPNYVPELDGTDNPAKDIPRTTTNITTGTTTANPDYAGDIPVEVPGGGGTPPGSDYTRPPTKKPPKGLGSLVVTKFPFSLPWDFFGILGWLQAEPKAPTFKLDASMPNPFGKDMQFKQEFSLSPLDDYIGFFRSFILIGFSIFLILATRKLMGGGS